MQIQRAPIRGLIAAFLLVSGAAIGQERGDWAEPIRTADATTKTLSDGVDRLLEEVEEAQRKNNVLRLNCLNEKLSQLQGLLKVVQDASIGLHGSVANENNDLSEHHYNKVKIASEQGTVILAEASACVGSSNSGTGQGTSVVVKGPSKPGDDGFGASPSGSTRTPEASPRE